MIRTLAQKLGPLCSPIASRRSMSSLLSMSAKVTSGIVWSRLTTFRSRCTLK
jgi:hypothetical protein